MKRLFVVFDPAVNAEPFVRFELAFSKVEFEPHVYRNSLGHLTLVCRGSDAQLDHACLAIIDSPGILAAVIKEEVA